MIQLCMLCGGEQNHQPTCANATHTITVQELAPLIHAGGLAEYPEIVHTMWATSLPSERATAEVRAEALLKVIQKSCQATA